MDNGRCCDDQQKGVLDGRERKYNDNGQVSGAKVVDNEETGREDGIGKPKWHRTRGKEGVEEKKKKDVALWGGEMYKMGKKPHRSLLFISQPFN